MKFDVRERIIAATPLMCLIVYLLVGFVWNIWHPTWAIFFLVPAMPFLLGKKNILKLITYPVLCIAVFVTLGVLYGWWHPAWLVFLTIPVYYILFPKRKRDDVEVVD